MKGYLHMRVPSRDAHGPEFSQLDHDMSGMTPLKVLQIQNG